jgi:phosphatidylglycerophosphate synthase
MIDKVLRTPKEIILSPVAQRLLHTIHPTTITIGAFGIGILSAVMVWQQYYRIGLALWLLNRLLDGLDGTVARLHRKQSDLGSYLDILLDTIIYAALPLALALSINTSQGYLMLALLINSFFINAASWMYLAAIIEKRKQKSAHSDEMTTTTMPGGLIEGTETIIFFCLFLLLPQAMIPLFLLMALLVLATVLQRLVWATRNL